MTITADPSDTADPALATPDALVAGAALGDERAWQALVARFGPMLWSITRAYRLGDADAADVTQATWCRLIDHLERLDDPARVGAWLATTARRECLRVLRGARTTVLCGDDLPEPATEDDVPSDRLELAERDEALWRGFGRLRDSDQSLLRLLIAEPAPSYEEISAALSIPVGSIGPTRARALTRLRRELQRLGADRVALV